MARLRKILRVAWKAALSVVVILLAYALIGTILSLIPVNSNAVPGDDVAIYLVRSDVHVDVVVPTRTGRIDWTAAVPPSDMSAKMTAKYLAFGWGSRDFYLNVPTWSDLTFGVVISAVSGTGGTALHATYMREPAEGADCRRLSLSSEQYDALVEYILSSGRRDEKGAFVHIDHEGYCSTDAFYEGTGRYSPLFTCNSWANSALRACGQKCCLWTFLPQPIFWKCQQ